MIGKLTPTQKARFDVEITTLALIMMAVTSGITYVAGGSIDLIRHLDLVIALLALLVIHFTVAKK